MRLATSAAAALAVVALVATATALGCTAARAAPAPASVPAVGSGGDPFYNERWGKFYTDVQHMLGLPTEYRIMSPWGGPGFSPAWENVPDSQLDMMIRWEDGVYVGIMAQPSPYHLVHAMNFIVLQLHPQFSSWWPSFLSDVDIRPEYAACDVQCYTLYEAAMNATHKDLSSTWKTDMDFMTWEKLYDAGSLPMQGTGVRMGQDGTVTKDGALDYHFEDVITMGSLQVVNATIGGDWFVEGFMWAARTSYTREHPDQTVADVYFDPEHGNFNALTVAMVITNNITITSRTWGPHGAGNSTSHYPRATDPYVLGFVQRRLPFEAPCPGS